MRLEKIKKKKDFVRLAKTNQTLKSQSFILQYEVKSHSPLLDDNLKNVCFGITVSKKLGNSVSRNLIKRRIRCIVKETLTAFKAGHFNFVIIARRYLLKSSYKNLLIEFSNLIKKIIPEKI